MAFKKTSAKNAPATNGADASWKSDGFINLYLPRANGGRKKLGAVALKVSDEDHKMLMEWLGDETKREHRLAILKEKLILEFNTTTRKEGDNLDLPE